MENSAANKFETSANKKRYPLALKNGGYNNTDEIFNTKNITTMKKKMINDEKVQKHLESIDSQNFSLRLSDSIVLNDSIEEPRIENITDTTEKSDVIVISDSSDDEYINIRNPNKENVTPVSKNITKSKLNQSSISMSSIDVSEIFTDEDVDYKNLPIRTKSKSKFQTMKESSLLTLDESDINMKKVDNNKNIFCEVDLTTPTNVTLRRGSKADLTSKCKQTNNSIERSIEKTKTPLDVNKRTNGVLGTPNSAKLSTRTTPLTKKDTRNILKAIKSTRAVYDSPGEWQKYKAMPNSNSESDTSVSTTDDGVEPKRGKKKIIHPAWINETESESGDSEIQADTVEVPKPQKTHVSRFLDPPVQLNPMDELSNDKINAISHWLMTNPLDARSDTSLSIVPPSERNSLSSGNSSLERLEEKYETPNNRDKFHSKIYTTCKPKTVPTPTRLIQSAKSRQTTMDSYLKKNKTNKPTCYTPLQVLAVPKKIVTPPSEERANFQIDDCADILDKVYGSTWRDKANDLLPNSGSKKKTVQRRDAGIQVDRTVRAKSKIKSTRSSDSSSRSDNGFDTFVKNIKPHFNSTKKSTVKKRNPQPRDDSFINDHLSSSASGGETTFFTAFTTPRVSNELQRAKTDVKMTFSTRRAIEICDSDTDDEGTKKHEIFNRRKLVYSDDENDSSPDTSEYDPTDVVLPKISTKIGPSKLITGKSRILPRATTKSFLASLSASVPLENTHPDAKKYRLQYKTTREELCKRLYKLYNEKIFGNKLPEDMLIEWNVRMRGTAGFCYNKTKKMALGSVERSSRLVLSTKILDTPDRLRDTLVHEMCHAATWLINEVSDGHGPFWRAWSSKAMKVFPELPPIQRCHDYKITTKFTYRCVNCGYSIGRHSKSLDTEKKRCGHCFGRFELLVNKTTKTGTVQVKTPNRQATGFALFVKENYGTVKKERHGIAHKEVMQILGQQFSAIKITKKNNDNDN